MTASAIYLNINKDLQVIFPQYYYNIPAKKITNTPYKFEKNVILDNNTNNIIKNMKEHMDIIQTCKINLNKLL